jgi:DNA-binding PadR family transcriptional regulator
MPRARRGDVKFLILEVLAERPMHGYDVMSALAEKREGYRPSTGSVYPTLEMLEDGGFLAGQDVEGKRVYTVTGAGRQLLLERTDRGGEPDAGSVTRSELRAAAMKLAGAVMQAARSDDPRVESRAKEIVDRARREIYALLATDEGEL